jgi:hypothetical protein
VEMEGGCHRQQPSHPCAAGALPSSQALHQSLPTELWPPARPGQPCIKSLQSHDNLGLQHGTDSPPRVQGASDDDL